MNKRLFLYFLFVAMLACTKHDKPQPGNPPVENKITFAVDSTSTEPGSFLTLTAGGLITKDTCTVQLGGKPVKLAKLDSLHYIFFVPVLSPGKYPLDLSGAGAANSPEVTIRNYDAITNPDAVIATIINDYAKLADSLEKNGLFNPNAANDAAFLRQLALQFNLNIRQCTAEQKEILAYFSRGMKTNNALFQKPTIDTSYIAARKNGEDEDISETVLARLAEFNLKKVAVIKQAALTAAALTLVNAFPVPNVLVVTIPAAIIAVWQFYGELKDAEESCGEAVKAAFNAIEMSEKTGDGTSSNPIPANTALPFWLRYLVKYRTLQKSDESSTNSNISTAIKAAYELETKDKSVKDMFESIKSRFSSFFGSVSATYTAFVSPVLVTAKEKIVEVSSKLFSISNISNPDIVVTGTMDGSNGLKIIFSNPANTITTATNFSFDVAYTQVAINNKIKVTEHAVFTPPSVPLVTTAIINSITSTTASSGGTITSDGGMPILAKGVCYGTSANPIPDILNTVPGGTGPGSFVSIITGLQPGITYHCRAFASTSAGIGYGNDLSFTTSTGSLVVGQSYLGGVIGYLLQPGDAGYEAGVQHGLIAASVDQSVGFMSWYNQSAVNTGATGTAIGTGSSNTTAIIASQGAGVYAAVMCRNYKGGGYTDWFLPSKDELSKLCANQIAIGNFFNYSYWTSSEIDTDRAWSIALNACTADKFYKDGGGGTAIHVRAVRAF